MYRNETSTVLDASATRNGAAYNLTDGDRSYSKFRAFAFADQSGTLKIDQSADGTTWRELASVAVVADTPIQLSADIVLPRVRARFVNGATLQTAFQFASALIA